MYWELNAVFFLFNGFCVTQNYIFKELNLIDLPLCLLQDTWSWRTTVLWLELWRTRGSLSPCLGHSQQTTMVLNRHRYLKVAL